jgi:hypothetical protein
MSVQPDQVRAGDEVIVALRDTDSEGWLGDMHAELQEETADGWRTILQLTGISVDRPAREYPPPIPYGQTPFEPLVGLRGDVLYQIPPVAPGRYRFSRKCVQSGPRVIVLSGDIDVVE